MPVIIIIVGLAVVLGIGSFMLRPEDAITPITEESTDNNENNEAVAELPDPDTQANVTQTDTIQSSNETDSSDIYKDGKHTVTTSYVAPGDANHTVIVTITLKDDIVTSSDIAFGGDQVEASSNFQSKFTAAYQTEVIGKTIDSIKLSRVGGASLTTNAFNEAVAKIKTTALN